MLCQPTPATRTMPCPDLPHPMVCELPTGKTHHVLVLFIGYHSWNLLVSYGFESNLLPESYKIYAALVGGNRQGCMVEKLRLTKSSIAKDFSLGKLIRPA